MDGIFTDGDIAAGRKTFDGLNTPVYSGAKRLGNHLDVASSVKVETWPMPAMIRRQV